MTGPPVRQGRAGPGYAVDGLLAGAAGLLVATVTDLGLGLLGLPGESERSPIVAVGGAFVDRTPLWLKEFAAAVFGTADKLVLLAGIVVVLVAAFAGLGLLARRRPAWAVTGAVALGGLALAAVLSRPSADPLAAAPTLVGVATSLVLLAGRHRNTDREGLTRREGIGLAGAVVGTALLQPVGAGGRGAATASRAAAAVPTSGAGPGPAGADLGVAELTPWRVGNDAFYRIDTALVVPRLTTAQWALRVWGEVEREVTIGWDELLAQPLVDRWVTLACVSNEVGGDLVGNARWTGWPVRELLARARPQQGADMVLSRSADGWTAGTPIDVLRDGRDALLAVAMNGEPLPFAHGFPVRLVVPGLYGYVSATKWVTELKVTRFEVDQGYWTPRGWAARGPVKTASRIDVPRTGREVPAGRVAVAGVAWAMHRGIRAVQVRVDQGPWQDARLAVEPTVDSWRQWVWEWEATPGSHTITVRAQDGAGQWQTPESSPVVPDGATGHHSVAVRVA